jgi:pimeloyl-ACP methyl ester carboxylesterase
MVAQIDAAVTLIMKTQGVKSVNIIAHSAGTFVAARYAQLHPQRVERLVLFGAPAPYKTRTTEPDSPIRFIQVSRSDQLNAFESKVRETKQLDIDMFESWVQAYLKTDSRSATRNPPSVRVPSGMEAAIDEMYRKGEPPYDPAKIVTPVLVIGGEWDIAAPPEAGLWLYQHLASPLKRFVIISRAGHRAHLERNRRQLYKETESFLRGGDVSGDIQPRDTASTRCGA